MRASPDGRLPSFGSVERMTGELKEEDELQKGKGKGQRSRSNEKDRRVENSRRRLRDDNGGSWGCQPYVEQKIETEIAYLSHSPLRTRPTHEQPSTVDPPPPPSVEAR